MDGLAQKMEVQSPSRHQTNLFYELDLSEQQNLSGGLDLALPVGLVVPKTNSDDVLGITKDGYEFTKNDLFKLIAQGTGIAPPAAVASVSRVM
jgi:hypothetical protein